MLHVSQDLTPSTSPSAEASFSEATRNSDATKSVKGRSFLQAITSSWYGLSRSPAIGPDASNQEQVPEADDSSSCEEQEPEEDATWDELSRLEARCAELELENILLKHELAVAQCMDSRFAEYGHPDRGSEEHEGRWGAEAEQQLMEQVESLLRHQQELSEAKVWLERERDHLQEQVRLLEGDQQEMEGVVAALRTENEQLQQDVRQLGKHIGRTAKLHPDALAKQFHEAAILIQQHDGESQYPQVCVGSDGDCPDFFMEDGLKGHFSDSNCSSPTSSLGDWSTVSGFTPGSESSSSLVPEGL